MQLLAGNISQNLSILKNSLEFAQNSCMRNKLWKYPLAKKKLHSMSWWLQSRISYDRIYVNTASRVFPNVNIVPM